MRELIRLEKVWKIYGQNSAKTIALKNVSLSIFEKEFVAILGPSGSGKSTLLHIMGLLDSPTKGKVFFDGIDTSVFSEDKLAEIRRKGIGFVFQFFYLFPTLTALENVMLPMIFAGVPKNKREKIAFKLLKLVGLEKRANHLPSELSGGEGQRVAIARALANNPQIILADEPTGNLDTKSGKKIMKILQSLNKKGITVVVVTHDPQIAKPLKRKIFIRDGEIVKEVGK